MSFPRSLNRWMAGRMIALVSLSLLATATVIGQQESAKRADSGSSAWFGVPLPAGLGDPHRPILDVAAIKPATATVPPGEESYRDLAGSAVRQNLEAIVGISRADRARGEKAWGRITGFRAADETHAWVLEQFKSAGLRNAETQTYSATQATWYPKSWEVKLLATAKGGGRDVVLESAFPTSGSQLPNGPVTAPLVFVGATTDRTIPDVDVVGKAAVKALHTRAGGASGG